MVYLKIKIQGKDMQPFFRNLDLRNSTDQEIFFNSVEMIQKKYQKKIKINLNESILIYCANLITLLNNGKSVKQIQNYLLHLLTPDDVMIGVPQCIENMIFDIDLVTNNEKERISLQEPIEIQNYTLT